MFLDRSHKAPVPVIVGFLLLIACAALAIWLSEQQRAADGWVRHTLEVENRVNHAQMLSARAEINRRGYLLTGSDGNVATFRAVRAQLLPELDALIRAVSDNPPQAQRARAFAATIRAKLDEEGSSIGLFRAGRKDAAIATVASKQSRAGAERLLAMADQMRGNEAGLLELRRQRADRLRTSAEAALAICTLLVLALALLVGRERRRRIVALATANQALKEDIDARKALEKDLDAARIRAETARQAKSNFLADMSHEIRTPMNGVIGFTELLLASELGEEQRRHAELIADSGRAMMRLLNDILDLSKIEAGQMHVVAEPFDLPHTLRACAKLMAPAIGQRGVAFDLCMAADLPKLVLGDGLRLRQILMNLLGNAAKFTAKGHVAFRASVIRDGRTLAIEIEDTGIGIARDRQGAVFEQFVQADEGVVRRYGGTGLGLPISAQLARLMGGDLRLDSEPGRGSRFTLRIPLRVPAQIDDGIEPPVAEPLPAAPPRDGAGLRVLVAEDHDVNQMLIQAVLDRLGYRSDLAVDGGEALAMATAAADGGDPYAIVLMDMQMPVMDGVEAARAIRAAGIDPGRLPILALTANAYSEDIATCLNAGMQAHLTKPLNGAELGAAIQRWTSASRVVEKTSVGAERFSPQLRERYAARRLEMIAAIEALAAAKHVSDADVAEISRMLHKFLGSAEMFGDAELAGEARRLEEGFAGWSRARRHDEVRAAAETMRRAA